MESDGVSNVSDTASDDSGNQSDCASNQPDHGIAETSLMRLSSDSAFMCLAMMQMQLLFDDEFDEMCLDFMKLLSQDEKDEEGSSPSRQERKRKFIDMGRKDGDIRLWNDYFGPDPNFDGDSFRQRFRMSRQLFNRIFEGISNHSAYFKQRYDGLDKKGVSPLQKCICAIRQLASGTLGDQIDEYIRIGERTANDCLQNFCRSVIEVFSEQYLRKPNPSDIKRLLERHLTKHGFPGMLGSIGCMHCAWKNYTSHTQGEHGYPTIMLEVVASQDLWIWHSYFGIKGCDNDTNVLNQSIVFNYVLHGSVPLYHFTANGKEYTRAYYLADNVYPECATLVKSFTHPQDPKSIKFAQRHESARKDVDRAFEVLQARWAIVRGSAKVWIEKIISDIMLACIIIHNMIVEDEGPSIIDWSSGDDDGDEDDEEDDGDEDPPNYVRGATIEFEHYLKRFDDLRDKSIHHQLQHDLVEHFWNLEG
ncbi:putative harbinger transposase-derived protein [Helianthus debilis subsp. tardiflorus]